MDFLIWLENTRVAEAISTSPWMFPALETVHYSGLALLLGGIAVVDLRLLGFAARLPLTPVVSLLPWVFTGFLLSLLSGTFMLIYGATSFGTNPTFWLKMGLMFLAGLNALAFKLVADRSGEWLGAGVAPRPLKLIAALSLLLWVAVAAAGRFMAFF